jgi:hypothetical protein
MFRTIYRRFSAAFGVFWPLEIGVLATAALMEAAADQDYGKN